jgi:hypothetical protein
VLFLAVTGKAPSPALLVTAALTALLWACAAVPAPAQAQDPGMDVELAALEATEHQGQVADKVATAAGRSQASNTATRSESNQPAGRGR